MSRLEKTKKEKYSKRKYKTICRVAFLLFMIMVTFSSLFIVEYRINKVLGNKDSIKKYIDIF